MRRSRAPLALMELTVMLLVFALAAALCLQAFVASSRQAARSQARDNAVRRAQTAAETLKAVGGTETEAEASAAERLGGQVEQGVWYILYDADWNQVERDGTYRLEALPGPLGGVESTEHLAQVRLQVLDEGADEDKPLCTLTVAWQKEVGGDD